MKRLARTLVLPLAVAVGFLATSSFRPHAHECAALSSDDEPPPECPLCGGDPQLHLKRLSELAVLRFELAFAGLMDLR